MKSLLKKNKPLKDQLFKKSSSNLSDLAEALLNVRMK
jgi:hypothetical protein